ncbi:hypothetical protein OG804_21000 [Nocardia sp. NBC_00416]
MTKNSTSSAPATASAWTGTVPVDDTLLAVTDSGGSGVPEDAVAAQGEEAVVGAHLRYAQHLDEQSRHQDLPGSDPTADQGAANHTG